MAHLSKQIVLRVPAEIVDQAQETVTAVQSEIVLDRNVTLSDVYRLALRRGLALLQRENEPKK